MSKKLTAKQYEFFETFARNDLSNALFPILDAQGINFTPELAKELLDMVDVKEYTEIIGAAFLEKVEFAALKRVDKIMRSDEYLSVVEASFVVSDAVHEERIRILSQLIPTTDEFAKEEIEAQVADLAS